MSRLWIVLGLVPGVLIQLVLATGDPCDPAIYNELDNPRRSTGYITAAHEDPLCDRHLPKTWYRFTSAAGTQMPTTCPDKMHCGTVVPIWMNGTHPTVADGVVRRQTCGNFKNEENPDSRRHCCEMSSFIAVKNCGSFYVYFLDPPKSCPYAYCAGSAVPCPAGKFSIHDNGMPPCSDAHPVQSSAPNLKGPIVTPNGKRFLFKCVIHDPGHDPRQRYRVTWTFDDKEDPNILPQVLSEPQRVAILDGALLKNHINSDVGCQVESYYEGMQHHMSSPVHSNTYFAGFEISAPGGPLTVDEKEWEKNVTITSTLPILCDHNATCCLTFNLDIDHRNGQEASVVTQCDWKLCTKHWNSTTNQASIQVPVIANKDTVNDGDKTLLLAFEKLQMNGGGNYTDIFTGHTPTPVPVKIKDSHAAYCSVTGDPHIHGFDFQTYHLFKTGDFTMCRVPDDAYEIGPFQVDIRTWPCGRVACVCGVVIREHNDVIVINECDQRYNGRHTSPTVEYPNGLRDSTVVQRSKNSNTIAVYLPSGTTVKVVATRSSLHVYMTTSGMYAGMCKGICGTNDGVKDNEFTYPNGKVDPICRGHHRCTPNNFFEGWRVPLNASMFDNPVPTVSDNNDHLKFCPCAANVHGHPAANCTLRGDLPNDFHNCHNCPLISPRPKPDLCDVVVNPLCDVSSWHQTRRYALRRYQGNGLHDDQYADVDTEVAPYHLQRQSRAADVPALTWPSDNGMTWAQARSECIKAVTQSQLYGVCPGKDAVKAAFVTDCMEDILMSGSTDFLADVTGTFTSECQSLLAMEPASYITNPQGYSIMKKEYSSDVCLDGCSLHGRCVAGGHCQCDPGWEGELCHLVKGQGPQLDSIRSGPLCDIQQRPCETVYIDATNLDMNEDFSCRVQLLDESGANVGHPMSTAAHVMSGARMSCQLPTIASASQRLAISATNDGHVFGNALQLRVFDSSCLTCDVAHCTHKTDACNIGGLCYLNGQKHPQDVNKSCDVTQSLSSWTVSGQTLAFTPTLSGPDADHLIYCSFDPPVTSGHFMVKFQVDGVTLQTVTLPLGASRAWVAERALPDAGQLTCQVELQGAVTSSAPVDLTKIIPI